MATHELGPIEHFPPGSQKLVSVEGTAIAIFHIDDKFYAIAELCPHRGGPLSEGKIENCVIACPWHGAKFDLATGDVIQGPATRAVKTYAVDVTGGKLYLNF